MVQLAQWLIWHWPNLNLYLQAPKRNRPNTFPLLYTALNQLPNTFLILNDFISQQHSETTIVKDRR